MVEIQLSESDARRYGKLYVSGNDIGFARYCAGLLIKRGWHAQPWERRGSIYLQQAAFTSALIISYSRPFKSSRGWSPLPANILEVYDAQERALHDHLIKMRDKVCAHSDSESYSVRPWQMGDLLTHITHEPVLRLSASEARLFLAMSERLLEAINRVAQEILPTS